MKNCRCIFIIVLFLSWYSNILSGQAGNQSTSQNPAGYLEEIIRELQIKWPSNRTINLVFHGHSVPAGYFKTPVVNTFESYPYLLLKELKILYPYAVINIINTSIGGENSVRGANRFKQEVLVHKPDVIFIDYALNDRSSGLGKSRESWVKMIRFALKDNCKVILFTPSPDLSEDILDPDAILEKHSGQVRELSRKFGTGLIDSYEIFRQLSLAGENLQDYMSQVNHPNAKGHELITKEILKYFK